MRIPCEGRTATKRYRGYVEINLLELAPLELYRAMLEKKPEILEGKSLQVRLHGKKGAEVLKWWLEDLDDGEHSETEGSNSDSE